LPDPLQESFATFIDRSVARPGTSHHVDVNGCRLHYLEWPGAPGAPTLLLLHGFLAHAHWWDFIAPWLAPQFRVIAPDFSGMGDSGSRPEYNDAIFQNEIAGLIDALGIAGCTVVGHSFGGRALLYACAQQPGSIARAIVVDSRLGSAADPLRGFDEVWRPKKAYADMQTILARFLLRPAEPAPAAVLAYMARHSIRHDSRGWVWKFDENVTHLFFARRQTPGVNDADFIGALQTPVDFIYGEESRVVTPARAALLANCLPNVQSVTGLPCCHHHLPLSQPMALLTALRILLSPKVR
jgi:pimeloyl-ACP methyl ester carboxylesterase